MPSVATAPGPRLSLVASLIYRPGGGNPLDFFANLARTYGDISSYRMAGEQLFLINEPRLIRDILVTHNRNFTKSRGLERSKRLLGQGLLTSEGAMHLRQRRLMQPAFHRDRIAGYADLMVGYADRVRNAWTDGATLDVAREMNRLTLSIVGKTLFDVDVESQAAAVGEALTAVMESFWMMMLPFAEVLERLPVPKLRRARMARARLDAIIYRMIADRRTSGRDHGDLLSMLLAAQDEDDGGGMTDQQVRDEAMTIFLAGHETTANALTWTWYLLGQAPRSKPACTTKSIASSPEGRSPRRPSVARPGEGRHRGDACIRRRIIVAGAPSRPFPDAYPIPAGSLVAEPICPARCPLLSDPGASILTADAGFGRASSVCLFSVRRRHAPHRRVVRLDGAGARRQRNRLKWRLRLVPGHRLPQPVVTLRWG
jgi:hypothetical protein